MEATSRQRPAELARFSDGKPVKESKANKGLECLLYRPLVTRRVNHANLLGSEVSESGSCEMRQAWPNLRSFLINGMMAERLTASNYGNGVFRSAGEDGQSKPGGEVHVSNQERMESTTRNRG